MILFCAGARISHFVGLAVPVLLVGWKIVTSDQYRIERLLSFMDPFKYKQGSGFQVVNSLYAIASGSVFGRGLGKSLQKYLYIPEPHNDFIFSVLVEELGFVGALTIIVLFILFVWRGIRIAMNAPDMMGSLIAIGMTSLIAAETVINIAVVTSTVPATGMPLPFISAGGTSTVFLLIGVGILLNISKGASAPYTLRAVSEPKEERPSTLKRSVTTRKAGEF
ncbi:MAG: FtsW/RodA/SpoVE family cell cycle protein [Clostridia bacterium]|nr:FtsW/RodA/SpoVE family cell cycle protein [Clostridia bacterium]